MKITSIIPILLAITPFVGYSQDSPTNRNKTQNATNVPAASAKETAAPSPKDEAQFREALEKKVKELKSRDTSTKWDNHLSEVKAKIESIDKTTGQFKAALLETQDLSMGGFSVKTGKSSTMTFSDISLLIQIPGEIKVGADVLLYYVTGKNFTGTDRRLVAIRAAKE